METLILETITPNKAELYLNRNTCNRKLRDARVDKYAHDMRNGAWTQCTVPIAFYDNGDIADGQHRLWAIIESGAPQKFYVMRELPREAGLNIDTGDSRTLVDNARISGSNHELTNEVLSISRAVENGRRTSDSLPNSRRLEIAARHLEVSQWVVKHGPRGRNIRNQCVLAAVARAWYHEQDKEKLARFCKVLTDGFADGEQESAAVALRNYLMVKRNAHLNQLFAETFNKVQNCIRAFMRGKSLTIVKAITEEPYPLKTSQLPAMKRTKAIATSNAARKAQRQETRIAQQR